MAFRQFIDTCRTQATKETYVRALHYFMKYFGLGVNDYDKLLDKDPKLIQFDICAFVSSFKADHSSAAVSTYLAAINKFYSMNDVTLNWKKINSYQGERIKVAEDRPYIHSEIQTLIQNTTPRNRSIILLMSSAGLRLGALPFLRIKDLKPLDKYNIYKINVYAKSVKSRYLTFCSPECRREIDLYLDYRRRWAERITDDSPLFRADYNIQKTTEARPLSSNAIRDLMSNLLIRSGLRKLQTEGKVKRSHIMANHGFRKFFETNAFKAGMDHMYLRRLMGQKSGLEDAYLKLSEEELLEGDSKHIGYVGVVDALTINEENKLRREVQTLKQEVTRFDKMQKQIEELNRRMGLS
jgi:integrase